MISRECLVVSDNGNEINIIWEGWGAKKFLFVTSIAYQKTSRQGDTSYGSLASNSVNMIFRLDYFSLECLDRWVRPILLLLVRPMDNLPTTSTFAVEDYVVFGIVLTLSVIVGAFYAVQDARSKSSGTQEYLLAGRWVPSISPFAIYSPCETISFSSIVTQQEENHNFLWELSLVSTKTSFHHEMA